MFLNLIVLAWAYVVLMMAAAEAVSPQGSWLGALVTLLLYGVLPSASWATSWPRRHAKRARALREQADAGNHAPSGPAQSLPMERIEPELSVSVQCPPPLTALTPAAAGRSRAKA